MGNGQESVEIIKSLEAWARSVSSFRKLIVIDGKQYSPGEIIEHVRQKTPFGKEILKEAELYLLNA